MSDLFDPVDAGYRTCPQCGRDCVPAPFATDRGMMVSFECPVHGVHTVIDPFEDSNTGGHED